MALFICNKLSLKKSASIN